MLNDETGRELRPRIYVASLTDYNNGVLHGIWVDALLEPGAMHRFITSMLADSDFEGAEEWAIHDFEGFGTRTIDPYDTLDRVSEFARVASRPDEKGPH